VAGRCELARFDNLGAIMGGALPPCRRSAPQSSDGRRWPDGSRSLRMDARPALLLHALAQRIPNRGAPSLTQNR